MQKFNHGGREDKWLVHVAALLASSVFVWKDVLKYDSGRKDGFRGNVLGLRRRNRHLVHVTRR